MYTVAVLHTTWNPSHPLPTHIIILVNSYVVVNKVIKDRTPYVFDSYLVLGQSHKDDSQGHKEYRSFLRSSYYNH